MKKFKVWDGLNSSEESAREIEAFDAEDAAIAYAEGDVDGNCDGIYCGHGGMPKSAEHGQPIHVQGPEGEKFIYSVAITEFEPVYGAVEISSTRGET